MKNICLAIQYFFIACFSNDGIAQEDLKVGNTYLFAMPSFRIEFPQQCLEGKTKWKIVQKKDSYDMIELEGYQSGFWPSDEQFFTMKYFSNPVFSDSIRRLTAKEIANDFRNDEIKSMQQLGVATGLYQMEEPRMYSDSIGGKLFYVLSYTHILKTGITLVGWLYVYVPKEHDNETLFCAHYTEIMHSLKYRKPYQARQLFCFTSMLQSMVWNSAAGKKN